MWPFRLKANRRPFGRPARLGAVAEGLARQLFPVQGDDDDAFVAGVSLQYPAVCECAPVRCPVVQHTCSEREDACREDTLFAAVSSQDSKAVATERPGAIAEACDPAPVRRPRDPAQESLAGRQCAQEAARVVEDREGRRRVAVGKDPATVGRPLHCRVLVREHPAALSVRPDDAEGGLDVGRGIEEDQAGWPLCRCRGR